MPGCRERSPVCRRAGGRVWLLSAAHLGCHLPQALDEERTWGIAPIRPRLVSRLEAFMTTAEAYHRLPAMRGTASRVLEVLRRRWPATPALPLYPAFRQDAPRPPETT